MAKINKLKNSARREEQRENWARAIELYRKALLESEKREHGSPDLSLFNRIGDIHLRLGDSRKAVQFYEQAIERYADQDLHTSAIALCNKVLRVLPERVEVLRQLGRLQAATGLVAEARGNYLRYATEMVRRGRTDAALEALEECVKDTADQEAGLRLAELFVELDRKAEALARLRELQAHLESRGLDAARVAGRILELQEGAAPETDTMEAYDPAAVSEGAPEGESGSDAAALEAMAALEAELLDAEVLDAEVLEAEIEGKVRRRDAPPVEGAEAAPSVAEGGGVEPSAAGGDGAGPPSPREEGLAAAAAAETRKAGDPRYRPDVVELPTRLGLGSEAAGREPIPSEAPDVPVAGEWPEVPVSGEVSEAPAAHDLPAPPPRAFARDVPDGIERMESFRLGPGRELELEAEVVERAAVPAWIPAPAFPAERAESERAPVPVEEHALAGVGASGGGVALLSSEPPESGSASVDGGALLARGEEERAAGRSEEAARVFGQALASPTHFVRAFEGLQACRTAGEDEASDSRPDAGFDSASGRVPFPSGPGAPAAADGPPLSPAALTPASPSGKTNEPMSAFREWVHSAPEPLLQRAREELNERGETEKARLVAERLAALDPHGVAAAPVEPHQDETLPGDSPRPYNGLETDVPAADFEELLAELKTSLSESQTLPGARSRTEMGAELKEMGLVDEAIRELQAAVREPHAPAQAFELLGEAFREKGRPRVAARLLAKAIEQRSFDDRESLGVLYQLGLAYQQLEERTRALECYEQIFSVDIDYRDIQERIPECSA